MPLPAKPVTLSPAGADLGLGGLLQEQVSGETEEMRKKRMAQMQLGPSSAAGGSLATLALFGGTGGTGIR